MSRTISKAILLLSFRIYHCIDKITPCLSQIFQIHPHFSYLRLPLPLDFTRSTLFVLFSLSCLCLLSRANANSRLIFQGLWRLNYLFFFLLPFSPIHDSSETGRKKYKDHRCLVRYFTACAYWRHAVWHCRMIQAMILWSNYDRQTDKYIMDRLG